MTSYANLDLPIKWKDEQVAKWASEKGLKTRRDCMKMGSIGEADFSGNTELLDFPELKLFTWIKETEFKAFFKCTNLTHVSLPEGLTSIGTGSFARCASLSSIDLPRSLATIGDYAFQDCSSLTHIELPYGLTSIGKGAFSSCSSLAITKIPDSVTSIGVQAFWGCKGITHLELPKGIKAIDEGAFLYCTNMTIDKLPDGLTAIEGFTFSHCQSLAITELPSGVASIGAHAFFDCPKLAITELPEGVTTIGYGAFSGDSNITRLKVLSPTPPSLDLAEGLNNFPSVTQLYVPDDSLEAYKAADGWGKMADRIHPMSEWVRALAGREEGEDGR